MRFQVPQFLEVEDRIFGQLTAKQFIYLAGGAGLSFVLYRFLPWYVAVLIIVPVAALSLALAFYKVNGKPFVFVLEAALRYFSSAKLYLWRKRDRSAPAREPAERAAEAPSAAIPRLSESRLKDLTWSLDIKENLGPGVQETMRGPQ